METVYWKTLIAVAESHSFSRAAERLCVTQSAVSRRIQLLEEHYRTQLLDRSTLQPELTKAGRLVVERARRIVAMEADLAEQIGMHGGRGKLTFGCTATFAAVYLAPALRGFMNYPGSCEDVNVAFDVPRAILAGVRDGRYELAVVEHCPTLALGEFSQVDLPPDELAFASCDVAGLGPGDVRIEQLLPLTLLVRSEGCCARTMLVENLARHGLTLDSFRKLVVVDDFNLIHRSIREGGATALLSKDLLSAIDKDGHLNLHHVPGFDTARRRTLVHNGADKDLSAPAAALANSIVRAFDEFSAASREALPEPQSVATA